MPICTQHSKTSSQKIAPTNAARVMYDAAAKGAEGGGGGFIGEMSLHTRREREREREREGNRGGTEGESFPDLSSLLFSFSCLSQFVLLS
jgi:hypothetical protein